MENPIRYSRVPHTQSSLAMKQRRSGYEPSDTETDWVESPLHKPNREFEDVGLDQSSNPSPLKLRRNASKFELETDSPVKISTASPVKRRHSKSPYKPIRREDTNNQAPRSVSPLSNDIRKNGSPFSKTERRRYVSPFKPTMVKQDLLNERHASPYKTSRENRVQERHVSPYKSTRGNLDLQNQERSRGSERHVSPYKPTRDNVDSKNQESSRGIERHVSPYKPTRENLDMKNHESSRGSERHISPYKPNRGNLDSKHQETSRGIERHVSPYKPTRESLDTKNQESSKGSERHVSPYKLTRENLDSENQESNKGTERSNHIHRSVSRSKSRDKERLTKNERESTHKQTPSVGEINEIVANAKYSKTPNPNIIQTQEHTESISEGEIFFSQDDNLLTMQKIIFPRNSLQEKSTPNPKMQRNVNYNTSNKNISMPSRSTVSRQSSNMSDVSGRTTESTRKFTANRQKNQTETAWFSCMQKSGGCRRSRKSPEKDRVFNEASFIEKAFVVETIRQFWADKYQPASLDGFTCHKQEAQLLKQLVSRHEISRNILLKGPSGSGKKALTMAYLHEIYGGSAWDISHDIRYFQIQEKRAMHVAVPITSSAHHVELNVYTEPNARYALMALVKQISTNHGISPEISTVQFKADYSVMVLYDVDKAAESIQHLIKWIMDCYTDVCKLVLCCEDDTDIIDPVRTRCEVLKVDAPVTHEIMEVLIQIARKESFDLSMSFAAKIANKSKQNLRRAIMALEACKAHNYPFAEDQPISMGWEEVLLELAREILDDPSPSRLCSVRGKFQKLLLDFVHPKLILQKLVEQFLKKVESSLKREIYYWHGYYEKKLPTGISALLKLEEFVAKFMSIYRKTSNNHQ